MTAPGMRLPQAKTGSEKSRQAFSFPPGSPPEKIPDFFCAGTVVLLKN
jgi:hypothetical protein